MKKNISEEEKENIWNQINLVDSINLVAVSEILKNGYPQLETVGYDHVSTIWLVLHHQGDYETRIKFRPLLEKAFDNGSLGIGQMNTYDMRTKDIRLANPGN